jgi:hypothetical protein
VEAKPQLANERMQVLHSKKEADSLRRAQTQQPSHGMPNPLEGTFTWEVTEYSRITERQWHSPHFNAGGHTWRLLMFPKGNQNNNAAENLSLYLDVSPHRRCMMREGCSMHIVHT